MVLKVSWIKILLIKLTNSSKHSLMLAKTDIEVHLMHKFLPPELFLVFLQQTCAIHYFRSKTHVFDGFMPFCCPTFPLQKFVSGAFNARVCASKIIFLAWPQRTCSIHNFRSKTHVYNYAWYLNALLHSFCWQLM